MPRVSIEVSDMVAMADQIRAITGTETQMSPTDMIVDLRDNSSGGGGDIDGLIDGTLTEITSNATSIRDYAFYNWSTLTSVYFPQVTNITGSYAFQGTFNSMDITQDSFPMATEIGERVFYSSKIKSANFSKVTTIGRSAFSNCLYLTSVDFAEATRIGDGAFSSCSKLVSINLPKVTVLEQQAFQRCSSLETISLPELTTLTTVNYGAQFSQCSKLKTINLPKLQNTVLSCFAYCRALTEVYLPEVKSVSGGSFYSCYALETVILPKATRLSYNANSGAFANCYSLKKLVLGTEAEATDTWYMNDSRVFDSCYHIKGTVNATYNPNGDKDGYIYVPLSRVEEVRTATNWVTYATQIMPWVATVEELDSIDNTLYDHACVGEVEYIYDGDSWRIFR